MTYSIESRMVLPMSFIDENKSISDPYRNFIHVSRYSRWLEEKDCGKVKKHVRKFLQKAILAQKKNIDR